MVRILAATDFSEESRPVLDYAAHMVRQCNGKMYLLHAVEPCMMNVYGSMDASHAPVLGDELLPPHEIIDEECTNTLLEAANERACLLAEEIGKQYDIPIYGKAEEADDIVDCVHQFCQRHHIDVLVIGNRHSTLLTSILLGNTAEKLMRASRIPVTVVPCGAKLRS